MEPVYVKEALYLLDRIHLLAIQNEGYENLQYEGIINMVEGITIRSKKQTSILTFFHSLVFFITCLYFTVLEFKN